MSEVFHFAGGPFNNAVENPRVAGHDPQARSYNSFASFEDPDGNGWLLQEIKERLPGREWKVTRTSSTDVATLGALLRETEEHHGQYEKTHAKHNWWDWYAPYLRRASERQQSGGGSRCRRRLYGRTGEVRSKGQPARVENLGVIDDGRSRAAAFCARFRCSQQE